MRTAPKSEPKYDTESSMCAAFTPWAQQQGWAVYPETEGWDMLLVNRATHEQIGVQAKLRFNPTLLRQVLPSPSLWAEVEYGPDYRAILIPKQDHEIDEAMRTLGVLSLCASSAIGFRPKLDNIVGLRSAWPADKRLPLPAYVPDVVAGASGPTQLTAWKVAALRLTAILEVRGYLTRRDFREQDVDFRRWPASDWLKPDAANPDRYLRGERLRFDLQHPVVFAEIRNEVVADLESKGKP